jgi:DNA-binding FadR family transcriptional regulator
LAKGAASVHFVAARSSRSFDAAVTLLSLKECPPVPKKSEVVAQAIVHDIVVRGLAPGDRLASEAEMMEQYDVGRGSLREALRMLELNGLVSLKPGPGGGPVVESVNPAVLGRMLTLYLHVEGATYRELVDARLAVEPTCAALAAATASTEAKQQLAALGARAHNLDLGDDAAYRAMSHEFHGAVVSMSGNRVLELLGHALMEIFDAHVARATRDIDTRAAAPDEHDAVIAAILEGDAAAAETEMRAHMEHYAEVFGHALPNLLNENVRWE